MSLQSSFSLAAALKSWSPKVSLLSASSKKHTTFSKIHSKLWTFSILSATNKGCKMNNHKSQELTCPLHPQSSSNRSISVLGRTVFTEVGCIMSNWFPNFLNFRVMLHDDRKLRLCSALQSYWRGIWVLRREQCITAAASLSWAH